MTNYFKLLVSLSLVSLVLLSSCGSSSLKFKRREVKKANGEYAVVDASKDNRPTWLDFPHAGRKNLTDSSEKSFYFSFESGPKISKEIACNIVRVYARDDLAKRVLDYYLGAEKEGDLSLNWKTILATEGSEIFKRNFKDSKILSSYWERRLYPPKIGDTEEIEGYSCALWIEVPQELFVKALEETTALGKKRYWKVNGWDKALIEWVGDYRRFHEETY
jgi:hypothetical protein